MDCALSTFERLRVVFLLEHPDQRAERSTVPPKSRVYIVDAHVERNRVQLLEGV